MLGNQFPQGFDGNSEECGCGDTVQEEGGFRHALSFATPSGSGTLA